MADSDKLFKFGLLAAVIVLVYYVVSGGTTATQTVTTTTQTNGGGAAVSGGGGGALEFCDTSAKTTITFSGVDKYAQGTTVSQGHRVLLFDGEKNVQYNNLGTNSYAAKSEYILLMGNKTTGLTANTDYYPQLIKGKTECEGAKTFTGDLVKTAGVSQLTFTSWNKAGTANSAENIGANANNVQNFRITASDNACFGNPYAKERSGKGNLLCAYYNTTAYTTVELLDSNANLLPIATIPKSMAGVASASIACFDTKDVWCDNADYNYKVHYIAGNAAPVAADGVDFNITIAVSDVSTGFNSDTLAEIDGYEDAPNRNDFGVADYGQITDLDGGVANGYKIFLT